MPEALPFSGVPGGAVYGVLVWGVNYLGVLPAAGLCMAPQYEPLRRHAMLITAHLVWGAALDLLFQQLDQDGRQAPRQEWQWRDSQHSPGPFPLAPGPTPRISQERYSY